MGQGGYLLKSKKGTKAEGKGAVGPLCHVCFSPLHRFCQWLEFSKQEGLGQSHEPKMPGIGQNPGLVMLNLNTNWSPLL